MSKSIPQKYGTAFGPLSFPFPVLEHSSLTSGTASHVVQCLRALCVFPPGTFDPQGCIPRAPFVGWNDFLRFLRGDFWNDFAVFLTRV
jgi:hypothetical protein